MRNRFGWLLLLVLCFGTGTAISRENSPDAKRVVTEEVFSKPSHHDLSITTACRRWRGRRPLRGEYSQYVMIITLEPFGTTAPSTPSRLWATSPPRGVPLRFAPHCCPFRWSSTDEYVDQQGKPLVLDVTPAIARVLQSPNFAPYNYGTGDGQFADAVQRAQFASYAAPNWHTQLAPPRLLAPVLLEVPVGAAKLYQSESGVLYAKIDLDFSRLADQYDDADGGAAGGASFRCCSRPTPCSTRMATPANAASSAFIPHMKLDVATIRFPSRRSRTRAGWTPASFAIPKLREYR